MAHRPRNFGRDRGLQLRMTLTMFLLGLVYAVLVAALLVGGVSGVVVAVVAGGLLLLQLFTADKLGLAAAGAREVSPAQEPELHSIIDRLCVQADLPKPRVAVVETPMPNAFAMGRSPKSATVCATRGILQLLSPAELEGVLGHELTHVQNRDVMVMTIASFFATIAAYIVQFGFLFGGLFGGAIGGGMGGNDRDGEGGGAVLVIVVSAVVYAISFLLLQALSRYREFSADRGSALLTGRPSALASALVKISGTMQRIPQRDLRTTGELKAFFIIPPEVRNSITGLFSTHPPLEKRLAALQRLEAQLQGTAV